MTRKEKKGATLLGRIALRMVEEGLDDEDIWERANIKIDSVRRHIKEGSYPSGIIICNLAECLNTSRAYLEGKTDDPARPRRKSLEELTPDDVKVSVPMSDEEKMEFAKLFYRD